MNNENETPKGHTQTGWSAYGVGCVEARLRALAALTESGVEWQKLVRLATSLGSLVGFFVGIWLLLVVFSAHASPGWWEVSVPFLGLAMLACLMGATLPWYQSNKWDLLSHHLYLVPKFHALCQSFPRAEEHRRAVLAVGRPFVCDDFYLADWLRQCQERHGNTKASAILLGQLAGTE